MQKPKGKGFLHEFDWGLYPKAEAFLNREIEYVKKTNSVARSLATKMQKFTSTTLFDWIDHLVIPEQEVSESSLKKLGFVYSNGAFENADSIFFPIRLGKTRELALKPEELDRFLGVMGSEAIYGERFASYRRAVISTQGSILSAVERRGSRGYQVKRSRDISLYHQALSACRARKRDYARDGEGMNATLTFVKQWAKRLNSARLADAFFRAERVYWQKKNRAGNAQYNRQQRLGLGWGNHDHHTYRSSREQFTHLIRIFESMGYRCREQFHAGSQAGWGAQILEHPTCGIVVFADVDLRIEESSKDFAHHGLVHEQKLGTVGLWIGLHGESVLQAGMHHLEARFNFHQLQQDLKKKGIRTLPAFSKFPFLKQAFVESQFWKVKTTRLRALLKAGSITRKQYAQFKKNGARGSHLENLQRRQGFKGFNQTSVSAIIKVTDPRNQRIGA